MTLALTYEADRARVVIQVDDMLDATHALVERSTDQISWATVRGGVAAPVSGGSLVAAIYDYEFASDVINYYRATAIPLGFYVDGASGNYASTPDHASLDITGDIDLRADVTMNDWTPAADTALVSKWNTTGNQRSYELQVRSATGLLRIRWSNDGTAELTASSSVAPTVQDGERLAVRATLDVNNGAAGRTATFYTAPTIAGPWTQLGISVVIAGTTSIFGSTATGNVPGINGGTANPLSGVVHAVEVRNGISGAAVANPYFYTLPHRTTSFVDTAGRTWTINGAAADVGVITTQSATITPSLGGQIWLKLIRFPSLNRIIDCANIGDIQRPARLGVFPILGRRLPIAISDLRGSRRFPLTVVTEGLDDTDEFDHAVQAGGVWFIHAPPEQDIECDRISAIPSTYVEFEANTTQRRIGAGGNKWAWDLPCVEVAAPGPDLVGITITWASVVAMWASWTTEIADNASWSDLLQVEAPPDSLLGG